MLFRHLLQPSISRVLRTRLISSTATQQDIPHFSFSEEPLGIPASEGYGYFQGGPGFTFGPDCRYKLQAKLGFGITSSVWLARDCIDNIHVAVKILSGFATILNRERKLRELEVLQRLSSVTPNDHCTRLLTQFVHPGFDDDKEHLCLVTELFGSIVEDTSQAQFQQGGFIPVSVVKRILKHVLLGIARLHMCGIAHTDIKPDNIMIDLEPHWSTEAIDTWLRENPPRTYAPERSLNKMVTAYVSQSLPPPLLDALPSCNFKLADYSCAQFVSDQTTDDIAPLDIRPPEIVLGGEWDESVDIWAFGCLVFTLLARRTLFNPISRERYASEDDVLLYEMISFCGESFKPDFLRRCSRRNDYFEPDGRLKKFDSVVHKPLREHLLFLSDPDEIEGATDLMTKCLRLDPKDRATARELLEHPWLMR